MACSREVPGAVVNHHDECTRPDHDNLRQLSGTTMAGFASPGFHSVCVVELCNIDSVLSARPDHGVELLK